MSVLFFFAIPPGISLLILIAGAADKARPPPHTLAYLTFIREMSFAMSEYKKPYINLYYSGYVFFKNLKKLYKNNT